ncbi:MAG: CvpA family protein [Clostridia bacterium]|nr:CvpA family protein [Clostridia bacterium]
MAIVDIICAAVLLIFGFIGLFKGFMRQILSLVSGIAALVIAFFVFRSVYNLLYGIGFIQDMINGIGGNINVDWPFLQGIAESAGKTQGVLVAEYGFKIILFILITIVIGLLIKLVKKLLTLIADIPGINVIDRVLGLALGLFWAALILFVVFFVLYLLKDSVGAIDDFLNNFVPESSLTNQWLIQNLENIKGYFIQLFDFVKGAFVETTTALV